MSRRARFTTLAAVVVACLVGGGAYAFFSSTGAGNGGGSTGRMQTVTLNATAGSPSTPLYPGGTGDLSLEVNNPNNVPVTLTSVNGTGGTIAPDAGHPSCTTTGVSFANQTGLSRTIPANATGYQVVLTGTVSMSSASSDGCQGATFSVPVSITVQEG